MRKSITLLVGMMLVVGACTNSGSTTTSTTLGPDGSTATTRASFPGLFASALHEFNSCDAFLEHIKAEAMERVGPYGLPGQGYYGGPIAFGVEEMAMDDGALRAASTDAVAAPQSAPIAGQDFSTTNVQEVGVDEPDIVKTDGTRILAVAQGRLHYIDVSSGDPVLTSTLDLPWGWNQELLMSGDTAIVMATASRYDLNPQGGHWHVCA